MPYINKNMRALAYDRPMISGELNYQLTVNILQYWERKTPCYDTINEIIGALEGCKAEFQRRIAAPYEDKKIKENGDVYNAMKHRTK